MCVTPVRKQKYFYKGGLVWDENSSDGRYVKENCKPLKVSLPSPQAVGVLPDPPFSQVGV